jgi:hypothetical protein
LAISFFHGKVPNNTFLHNNQDAFLLGFFVNNFYPDFLKVVFRFNTIYLFLLSYLFPFFELAKKYHFKYF